MTKPKKNPKTGDVVGWVWMLDGNVEWISDTRKDAIEFKKDARIELSKSIKLAKIVLAK